MNMCEKFHYDRPRNDRSLGNRKSDNNKKKNKNNVRSAWRVETRFRVLKPATLKTVMFMIDHGTTGRYTISRVVMLSCILLYYAISDPHSIRSFLKVAATCSAFLRRTG